MNWVGWLIDAATSVEDGRTQFLKRFLNWLEDMAEDSKTFDGNLGPLALLTLDLAETSPVKERYRALLVAVRRHHNFFADGAGSRRQYLMRFEGHLHFERVAGCWRRHIGRLVPDPGRAVGSLYDSNALWLIAAGELDRAVYEKILGEWRVKHKLKRNLWTAFERFRKACG